jgi:hypothetical protein
MFLKKLFFTALILCLFFNPIAFAQQNNDQSLLTLERIYASNEL